MSRLFWVALGATAGVLVVRRVSRAAQALTPAGVAERLADSVGVLGRALGEFSAEVRVATNERDAELRAALGIDPEAAPPARTPQTHRSALTSRPGKEHR